ncbi:hypothetical protein ACJMK2_035192 [Sinanodonta woodiana]|uniref:Uncharacterized protein n=1 Tax=Sinanodonta woodiana TaxID=1069815 RepID=A0ABD3WXL2_SINWO
MEEQSLASVLKDKYNIDEEMRVEGTFVQLVGADKEAIHLVKVGITAVTFVLARVELAQLRKDYELVSVTPLSLVSLGIQNYRDRIISVRSQFKGIQSFQLCSSDGEDFIWQQWVQIIKILSETFDSPAESHTRRDYTIEDDKRIEGKSVTNIVCNSSVTNASEDVSSSKFVDITSIRSSSSKTSMYSHTIDLTNVKADSSDFDVYYRKGFYPALQVKGKNVQIKEGVSVRTKNRMVKKKEAEKQSTQASACLNNSNNIQNKSHCNVHRKYVCPSGSSSGRVQMKDIGVSREKTGAWGIRNLLKRLECCSREKKTIKVRDNK